MQQERTESDSDNNSVIKYGLKVFLCSTPVILLKYRNIEIHNTTQYCQNINNLIPQKPKNGPITFNATNNLMINLLNL